MANSADSLAHHAGTLPSGPDGRESYPTDR